MLFAVDRGGELPPDAAHWAASLNEARAVIVIAIRATAADAFGGARPLAELEFLTLSRRAGFPEPKLRVDRRDASTWWVSGRRVLRFPSWLIRERPHKVIDQLRRALITGGWEGSRT